MDGDTDLDGELLPLGTMEWEEDGVDMVGECIRQI